MEIKERFRFCELFSLYGELISSSYKDKLDLFYDKDLSVTEIAELNSISKQAVVDGIKNGEKMLEEYENKLHLLERKKKILNMLDRASTLEGADKHLINNLIDEVNKI